MENTTDTSPFRGAKIAPVLARALPERPPRLVLRFALYTGLVLLATGIAILWVVQREITGRAARTVESQSRVIAEANLSRHLSAADFSGPVPLQRRSELDGFFREGVLVPGVVSVALINRRGEITYANNHMLIGTSSPGAPGLREAFAGQSKRRVTFIASHGRSRKVLEALVPVRPHLAIGPIGVLRLDQSYAAVSVQIPDSRERLALILALALLALYASLFPILRRVTSQLEARNSRLAEQAAALSDQAGYVNLLQEVAVAANASATSEEALAVAVERICAYTGWLAGHAFRANGDTLVSTTIWHAVETSELESFRRETDAIKFESGLGIPGRVLADRRPYWFTDLAGSESPRAATASECGLRACIAFPVLVGDEVVAVLEFFAGEPQEPDQQVKDVMAQIGTQLGRVVERERNRIAQERLLAGERLARAEAETAQRLFAEQNERLRELDKLKDEFVSLVSHELRTPLTSIRGYIELLRDGEAGELSPEQERFLGIVDRNSDRLLHLVGDLLFLAQIDAGKLTLELEEVDLTRLVNDCVEGISPVAKEREIELVTNIEPVPALNADSARLAQVLDNLVSNALKFTPRGGRVQIGLTAVDGFAVLEIEDTGVGIPIAEQKQLFERFFRSSTATDNAIPGTGLGLSIARAIVDLHAGRISLESSANAGTTARVELPIRTPAKLAAPAREIAA